MKKLFCLTLFLVFVLTFATASAGNMGVQVIGGPQTDAEPVSLDDIKLNVEINVSGFGTITPTSYAVVDLLNSYKKGKNAISNGFNDTYSSGEEAEYVIFRVDILNTKVSATNYLDQAGVTVVSDDLYEFGGWFYQYNYDNKPYYGDTNIQYVINPDDNFSIDPMYTGHYVFGATLPNAVINAKTPLRMEIKIGENELTYNIRK